MSVLEPSCAAPTILPDALYVGAPESAVASKAPPSICLSILAPLYSRRGDFQSDKNGYLVNGAGYYLMGIPVDSKTGNVSGSSPTLLQFQNGFQPAQATSEIDYQANLASSPATADFKAGVVGSELLNQSNFSAN